MVSIVEYANKDYEPKFDLIISTEDGLSSQVHHPPLGLGRSQNQAHSSTSGAFQVQSTLRFLVSPQSLIDEDSGLFLVAPLFLVWKLLEREVL